jgi:hypothetical protein
VDWLFGLFSTGSDRDISAGDNFPDRLLEFMNPLLDFTHEKEWVELEEDFDIDARTRAAGTDFMQSIVVVQVFDKLAEDAELGGLLDRSIEKIVYGGGGHGPGGVKHKKDPDERGEGIQVPAPSLIPKEVREKESGKHGRIEAGF